MPIMHPIVVKRRTRQAHLSGINQKDLAERLGIDVAKMGRYERGQQIPDYYDAVKLGEYFDMEWHQLVEMCVQFQRRKEEFIKFFSSKKSECSNDSHVCTSHTGKCGAR